MHEATWVLEQDHPTAVSHILTRLPAHCAHQPGRGPESRPAAAGRNLSGPGARLRLRQPEEQRGLSRERGGKPDLRPILKNTQAGETGPEVPHVRNADTSQSGLGTSKNSKGTMSRFLSADYGAGVSGSSRSWRFKPAWHSHEGTLGSHRSEALPFISNSTYS